MRNVVCICIDAVRRDLFKAYNPNSFIDLALPLEQVMNVNAMQCYSPSSWTGPVIASMFTGLHPSEIADTLNILSWWDTKLPDQSLLSEFNNTWCFTSNPCMQSLGFEKYFDNYLLVNAEHIHVEGDQVQSKAASFKHGSRIASRVTKASTILKEPFFIYIHLMDAHYPTSLDYMDSKAVRAYNDEHIQKYISGAYTATVQAAECLKPLMQYDPIVAVFADHGDAYKGEHGIEDWRMCMHTGSLYNELINVPLLMNIDLGEETIPLRHLFRILASLARNEQMSMSSEPIVSQVITLPMVCNYEQLVSMVSGDSKIIYNVDRRVAEKYDLKNDPKELNNLGVQDPNELTPIMDYIIPHDARALVVTAVQADGSRRMMRVDMGNNGPYGFTGDAE